MNLTKLEKGIIVFLVLGAILGAGIFFFIVPAYKGIDTANNSLKTVQQEQQRIEEKLSREATIDTEISDAKKDAKNFEKTFYPDLSTYETVEITLAHLKECNLDTLGVTVSPLSTADLSLSVYNPFPVVYDLKTYSEAARGTDENALAVGEFIDGGKRYGITVSGVSEVTIVNSESGEEVPRNKYTNTMKAAYKEALCRYAVDNGLVQTLGVTMANFTVTGTYGDYLKFIDYVFDIDRATYMSSVVIPMTTKVSNIDKENGYGVDESGNVLSMQEAAQQDLEVQYEDDMPVELPISIIYYCVEPMEEVKSLTAAGQTIVLDQ